MFRKIVLASAIALAAVPAQAALFDVTLKWNGDSLNYTFNQAEDAIDVVDIDFIKSKWTTFGTGTGMDKAVADITFRGVPLQLTYSTNMYGQEELTLKSDALGLPEKTFSGYDPLEDLKDYLI